MIFPKLQKRHQNDAVSCDAKEYANRCESQQMHGKIADKKPSKAHSMYLLFCTATSLGGRCAVMFTNYFFPVRHSTFCTFFQSRKDKDHFVP